MEGCMKTLYQKTHRMKDFSHAADQPFERVCDVFAAEASSTHVPTGMAMLKMAILLEAIDYHVYITKELTLDEAREKIRWAAKLMDEKFDLEYKRLPQ